MPVWLQIVFGLVPIALALIVYIRTVEKRTDEVHQKVFGIKGTNGMSERVEDISKRTHSLANAMQRYETQQDTLEKIVDAFGRKGR